MTDQSYEDYYIKEVIRSDISLLKAEIDLLKAEINILNSDTDFLKADLELLRLEQANVIVITHKEVEEIAEDAVGYLKYTLKQDAENGRKAFGALIIFIGFFWYWHQHGRLGWWFWGF